MTSHKLQETKGDREDRGDSEREREREKERERNR